jgi:hypothetical protein
MHVVITCGNDKCSAAKLKSVIELNQILRSNIKNYKLASIQYMSRNNDLLKLEMTKMVASVQKKSDSGGDLGRWIPAKVANIEEKLTSVIDWFDGVPQSSINFDNEKSLLKAKRFIMFTICVNDELLDLG